MPTGLFEVAAVVLGAAVLGVVAKLLKQPLVLAYLATGGLIAYFNLFDLGDAGVFHVFSQMGIMFLLFLVGLEMNYTSLRLVGKAALTVGVGQIVITFLLGFLLALLFGFASLPAAYIAIALTFSSTVIIVSVLSQKHDLHSLYGRISVGVLLVQDLLVMILLVVLSGASAETGISFLGVGAALLKGIVLFGILLFLGRRFVPYVFDRIARSYELLFLVSVAWVFLTVALAEYVGFSIEIGGLVAGLTLANSSERFQIASRIAPLRDFFILVFFVILGSSIVFTNVGAVILPVIVFSLFVLIGNPLIVLVVMGILGYRKRTSFLTGVTIAQISEFSFVLAALGMRLGHISGEVVALVTAVGVVTITASTYMIVYSDAIFRRMYTFLSFFERTTHTPEDDVVHTADKPIVLIGCHRTGASIAFSLPKEDVLVVDFDPEVIQDVKRHGFDYVFGDITDPEVFDRAGLAQARLVISTSPHVEDNLALLAYLDRCEAKPKVVVRAEDERDARVLYKAGADYVLLPHFTSGQYLGKTIALDPDMRILDQLRERDLSFMRRLAREV